MVWPTPSWSWTVGVFYVNVEEKGQIEEVI